MEFAFDFIWVPDNLYDIQATKLFGLTCLHSSLNIRFKRKRKRDDTAHRPPDDVKQSKKVTDEVASESPGLSSDDCRMEHGAGPCTGENL